MISGSRASARARPTRFRMPPESSAGFLRQTFSGSPTSASRASTISSDLRRLLRGVLPQGKGHVLGDRHAVEQGRLLEEEAEADPLLASVPARSARPGRGRRSRPRRGVGRSRPMIVFKQHRLAAAALADDRPGSGRGGSPG